MSNKKKILIIGVGDDGAEGLTKQAADQIGAAEVLVGSATLLAKFPHFSGRKEVVGPDLDRLANTLDLSDSSTVVLASGDPLFYGTARFLCDRLGKDRFDVLPHVSSMQLAFARVKESWDEAYLTNLASQPLERVIDRIRSAEKVGVFTSEDVPPARLAEELLSKGISYFTAYVCENLGSPDERVTRCALADVVNQRFSPLNVMILVRQSGVPDRQAESDSRRLFGNPDELFRQSKPKRGLLTPNEVRSIALGEMSLKSTSIMWDIGAGSGSVAIEAAQIARHGKAYAIEMDAEDYNLLVENARHFGSNSRRSPQSLGNLARSRSHFRGWHRPGRHGIGDARLAATSTRRLFDCQHDEHGLRGCAATAFCVQHGNRTDALDDPSLTR